MTRRGLCVCLLLLLCAQGASGRRLQVPSLPPDLVDGTLPDGETIPPDYVVQGQEALEQLQQQSQNTDYGNMYLPSSYEATDDAGQPNCGVALNASRLTCNRLIFDSNNFTCDCYNFCDGVLAGCYDYGGTPPLLECAGGAQDLVLGCRANFSQPVYNQTAPEPCPPGYMCSRDSMQLCEIIRQIPLLAGLGDVHAGMYCPGSENRRLDNGYKLCEPGYYCPNSTTMEKCPAGFYCPHKTLQPEMKCKQCDEGTPDLVRETYGYIVVGCAMGLVLIFMIWRVVIGRNQKLSDQLADMQSQSMYSVRSKVMFRKQRKELQALKPKLKVIEKRMNKESDMDVSATSGITTERPDGSVQFDASQLFDALDADGNGELSYKELNTILRLKPPALREFANRMNQAAKEPPGTNTISRPVFVRFFLTALAASSHFEPTPEEADQLYDQLVQEAKEEKFDVDGGIPHEAFYKCESMAFLPETKILELLTRFEAIKASEGEDESVEEGKVASSLRSSNIRQPSSFFGGTPRYASSLRSSNTSQPSSFFGGTPRYARRIKRNEFVVRYPTLLMEVTGESEQIEKEGVDIAFENLCLTVKKGDKEVQVVNDVTGRLRSGTMTALMGGSGAGKTSLLNALCGRAHYGEVTGTIKINGQESSIEEHADSVGFVPQDDIVFAELTVRENLIYAGKFQLPRGTPLQEIEDLADQSLAGLGLSRVQHNLVGDVNRRGVSGGEKKRVNIGLELMSRPKILFLDEPTSGLDSSSAMLVMQSMKNLVEKYGITVCSVIHQPRKTIFELFDSLVLLGAGGFLVYHGQVRKANKYFWRLGYDLPEGESLADWLIDISTGSLKPEVLDDDDEDGVEEVRTSKKEKRKKKKTRKYKNGYDTSDAEGEYEDNYKNGYDISDAEEEYEDGTTGDEEALGETNKSELGAGADDDPELLASDAEKEAARREFLYKSWRQHFAKLSKKKKSIYSAPKPFDLPTAVHKPTFLQQLGYQVHRLVLLAWRNWYTKMVDTCVVVGAVILVSALDGVVQPTKPADMNELDYYAVAQPSGGTLMEAGVALVEEFPKLFAYALKGNLFIVQYNTKLSVLIAVLVGLMAAKTITEKRNEFFREAGSGYNIDAYFVAVNIVSTVEHSLQVIFSSMVALWLRNSVASWYSYYIHFLLLGWLSVSWGILFPLMVPPKSVVLVTAFYCTFFSLMFSGGIDPVKYEDIYDNAGIAIFSGLLSPARYFIEAMTVAESRCLPGQSGFTNLGKNLLADPNATQAASFSIVAQGLNDFGNVTQQGCNGWYWGVWPALVVGFGIRWLAGGINHASGRPQQSKKPLRTTLARNKTSQLLLSVWLTIFIALVALSVWLILRKTS